MTNAKEKDRDYFSGGQMDEEDFTEDPSLEAHLLTALQPLTDYFRATVILMGQHVFATILSRVSTYAFLSIYIKIFIKIIITILMGQFSLKTTLDFRKCLG